MGGGWGCGVDGNAGDVKTGFTVILICLLDGPAMELILGN